MLAVPDPKTVEFPVSCAQLTGKLFLQATGMILLSCAFRGGHPPDVNKLKWHLKSEKLGFTNSVHPYYLTLRNSLNSMVKLFLKPDQVAEILQENLVQWWMQAEEKH